MIDPEKEIRRRIYNRIHDVQLTYDEFCLLEIKQMTDSEIENSKSNA